MIELDKVQGCLIEQMKKLRGEIREIALLLPAVERNGQ